jgi:hypothetical protein
MMPTFEIQLRSGKVFQVQAADEDAAMKAVLQYGDEVSPPAPSQRSSGLEFEVRPPSQSSQVNRVPKTDQPGPPVYKDAMDIVKSIGTGARSAVTGTLGAIGSAREGLASGAGYLATQFGLDPLQAAQAARTGFGTLVPGGGAPSAKEIEGAATSVLGAPYKPQSIAGEWSRTAADNLLNAVGPGGMARKVAMVLAPTAATEATRELTRGTSAEKWAPDVAGLVGGVGASGLGVPSAASLVTKKGTGTLEDIRTATNNAYDWLRSRGIKYDANAWTTFRDDVVTDLRREGFRPIQAPKAHDIINGMADYISPDFSDVESLRQAAGGLTTDPVGFERAMGSILKRKLDKFTQQAPFMTTTGNNTTPQIQAMMTQARELASRKIKAENLTNRIAAGGGYVSGDVSGLKNQFSSLDRRIGLKKERGFTDMERQAIRSVHQGTFGQRAGQTVGATGLKLAKGTGRENWGPGLGAGGAAAVGGALFGPVGAVAAPLLQQGIASAGQGISQAATRRAAQGALGVTLAGRGAQNAALAQRQQMIDDAMKRLALILGTSTTTQQP